MSRLIWDEIGERVYEKGLNKGVLYLLDGSAIPWNGLTSIVEQHDREVSSIYFDGKKINNVVYVGPFSATMKAITYPDEFIEIEGLNSIKNGVFVGEQSPLIFNLCYQTKIGNDVVGDSAGYKIHIIYNLMAFPNENTFVSDNDSPSPVEFEWIITSIPEEIPGLHPLSHIIIDSRKTNPDFLAELESKLYGDDELTPSLMPLLELFNYINNWHVIQIIDNGDGTWTAISSKEEFITVDEINRLFTINNANATYVDANTYVISDTD